MKFKSIIAIGLLLLGVGAATTSCEDMFTAENNLVTTDLTPKDTLYQVMGIIQRMQKLADRTVLLGEVRADLLDVDPIHASSDIQELYSNEISTENEYNKPADYYAVINNCNLYLAGVDSTRQGQGTRKYFEKEILAVKCFRAWCYLELAKIYGSVPFITEPVITSDAAEKIVASGQKADMGTILDFCINDLKDYENSDENQILRQAYGKMTYEGFKLSDMVFPFRALLGELYLWRASYTQSQEDYINAIRMYHDYFAFPNEEIPARSEMREWEDIFFRNLKNAPQISTSDYAVLLPLEYSSYYGNVSNLYDIFSSTPNNYYYPSVLPSERVKQYSRTQDYFKYYWDGKTDGRYAGPHDANYYADKLQEGDLRFITNYELKSNFGESQFNSNVNSQKQTITKFVGKNNSNNETRVAFIPLFRNTILYLHMAEALNRAGFPETAFAILKYGLSYDTFNGRTENINIGDSYFTHPVISNDEFERLCEIKSKGFTNIEPLYASDSLMAAMTNSSFVLWNESAFSWYTKNTIVVDNFGKFREWGKGGGGEKHKNLQIGIHSLGCGDTDESDLYVLDDSITLAGLKALPLLLPEPYEPVWNKRTDPDSVQYKAEYEQYMVDMAAYLQSVEDRAAVNKENALYLSSDEVRANRQARVKQLILDEEALEGMFEGYRFYDILRYQMQEGKLSSTITLPEYLNKKYGNYDNDHMTGKPWYLPLPRR